jgi:hypothetical protein
LYSHEKGCQFIDRGGGALLSHYLLAYQRFQHLYASLVVDEDQKLGVSEKQG